MRGFLDTVGLRTIRGWAIEGDGPPYLVASVNNNPLSRFRPSLYRPDLVDFDCKELGFEIVTNRLFRIGDIVSVTDDRGEHLVGSPKRITKLEGTREEKALVMVSREMKILEIGPSYNPIAPRSRGWRSFTLDHATQEELRAKYEPHHQPVERIELVDYLWKGGPIDTAVPTSEHGTFDALIGSHVIEHMPDPISFFQSASLLLKKDGLLSLVIPDKRVTFDFFKPITLTSDYLQAHYFQRTRHSKKTAFDNVAFNVSEKGDVAWFTRPVGDFRFFGEDVLRDALRLFDETIEDESSPYADFHATVYTPSSFALIIFDLAQLEIVPFALACTFPTSGCEFYVTLRKGQPPEADPGALKQERLRLLKETIRELGQQARWLLDDSELA